MHSWPMMVESMSATNSFLRRPAIGWSAISTGAPPSAWASLASRSRAIEFRLPARIRCRAPRRARASGLRLARERGTGAGGQRVGQDGACGLQISVAT